MRLARVRAASRAIISNAQAKLSIVTEALDPDRSAFGPNRDGVVYGIFGQRLHGKGRNIEIEGLRVNFQIHLQTVLIAKLLEGDVLARELVLFRELNQFAAIFL